MKYYFVYLSTIVLCSLTINVMSQNIDIVNDSHDELINRADIEMANYKFEHGWL